MKRCDACYILKDDVKVYALEAPSGYEIRLCSDCRKNYYLGKTYVPEKYKGK